MSQQHDHRHVHGPTYGAWTRHRARLFADLPSNEEEIDHEQCL